MNLGTLDNRTYLRLAAIIAAREGQLDMLDAFHKMGKVPINYIPADEKVNPWETPLVAAVIADRGDVALHLLSLAGSEGNLDLGRVLDRGNTLLHHAAERSQCDLVDMLIQRGVRVDMIAKDGHTPLSAAIDNSNYYVAMSLFQHYRTRGQIEQAFEKSFYDHKHQQFVPLLHRVSSWEGRKQDIEAEMLFAAGFLIWNGADVGVRNGENQTPADVALSRCGFPFLYLVFPECGAVLLHQFLRHVEDGSEDEGVFTTLLELASSPVHETEYLAWSLLACGGFLLWRVFTGDERSRRKKRAAEETARNLALEEEQEERKKMQQGKNDKNKGERTTLRESRPPPSEEEEAKAKEAMAALFAELDAEEQKAAAAAAKMKSKKGNNKKGAGGRRVASAAIVASTDGRGLVAEECAPGRSSQTEEGNQQEQQQQQ